MATYRISPGQVAKALRAEDAMTRRAIRKGAYRAAMRGKTHLVQVSKAKGKVDLGQFINSFQVQRRPDGTVVLLNDSPMAGVIELGARPHPVSEEGVAAIAGWVRRKLLADVARQASKAGKKRAKTVGPLTPMAEARHAEAGGMFDVDEEARRIAFLIAQKIRRHGQEPTYIFRGELPELGRFLREEVERARREAERGPGGAPA